MAYLEALHLLVALPHCGPDGDHVLPVTARVALQHGGLGDVGDAVQQQGAHLGAGAGAGAHLPPRAVAGAPQLCPLLLCLPGRGEARTGLIELEKLINSALCILKITPAFSKNFKYR